MPALTSGTRLGPYDVLGSIGEGGMGEVYRATDSRLKRQVALKVLPVAVTADPDRLARFQREAEVLASLNHPNIAGIYGLEESGGVKALVMELVEGPTLADRIAQGPVPLDEALAVARQIAEALEAAHDQNIIHRDLKPANIKLRPDGTVKVLDFGLAKAMDPASGGDFSPADHSPTITSPTLMTGAGMILGTAAYMSPEQAAGKPVDRRTDMWAFGVVLLEMLTGKRVFDGETVSHVIASVLKDEPDWSALPPDTPAPVRKLLRRCLEKDRRKRMPDAAVARLECDDAIDPPRETVVAPAPLQKSRGPGPVLAGAVVGALVAGLVAWGWWPAPPVAPPSTRFAIDLPADQVFTRAGRHVLALSPDGTHLVYVANRALYLHSFSELTPALIGGTANADPSEPVFSPDGAWIAFWSNGALKKIPVSGGSAIQLAEIDNPLGLTWTGDQIVVGQARAVLQVPADGGTVRTLMTIDKTAGEWIQTPQLVDDGRAVLFTQRINERDWSGSNIVVQDLASGTLTTLVQGGTDGRALPGGLLIYARENALFAVAFDSRKRETSGPTVPLERGVLPSVGGFTGASQMTWSPSGSLAYAVDDMAADSTLTWMTRQGGLEPTALPARPQFQGQRSFALSPDGKRVAIRLMGTSRSQTDVWIGDIGRGTFTRLTSSGTATDPQWTADGSRVCYRESPYDVRCQPSDGSAPSASLFQLDRLSTVAEFSRKGDWLLLSMSGQTGGFDIWATPNRSPFEPKPLLATSADEGLAVLSPDGRWLAYQSNESGGDEIYVRPFPEVAQARWQVSASGGAVPRWSRDGRELYFLAVESAGATLRATLTAVPVIAGTSFTTGTAVPIGQMSSSVRGYDVAPDGRFLIVTTASSTGAPTATRQRIVVVQHWLDALRRQLGATAAR
ncbi:MAG: protein kinase [Acidobacteriota bacterium]|nr:protein kinase [Acidobacteriota bacterium]